MKTKISLLLILLTMFLFAQKEQLFTNANIIKQYLNIEQYKQLYPDSINYLKKGKFIINENGDTLIQILDNKNLFKDKVRTKFIRKPDSFLKFYEQIAFVTPKKNKNDSNRYHRYWKEPIKIFFGKSIPKKVRKHFMRFAESLEKNIDSLQIERIYKLERANYVIYYEGDFEYDSRFMASQNVYDSYVNWEKNQIHRANLKIHANIVTNESLQLSLMKRAFIKSLGYFSNKNNLPCESAFSTCETELKEISEFDLSILKYHYSYGFCMGVNLKSFKESHKRSKEIKGDFYILQ